MENHEWVERNETDFAQALTFSISRSTQTQHQWIYFHPNMLLVWIY